MKKINKIIYHCGVDPQEALIYDVKKDLYYIPLMGREQRLDEYSRTYQEEKFKRFGIKGNLSEVISND